MVILPHAPIALSPDGRWVAAGETLLYLFDTATFELAATLAVTSPVTAITFVDDHQLALGHKNGAVALVALASTTG
ncbi:MAG: hypothetical protein IPL61_24035 [Myxococcales bacterium]|nr:hypothetical protein [Myxococcales bacterium]